MQKILLTGALCLVMNGLCAQPWMTKFEGQDKVKLEDVIRAYKANPVASEDDEEEAEKLPAGSVKEAHNYQFDRWRWYWEQHLDADGYMVSPMKNYQEWEAYKSRQKNNMAGKSAKTTATTSSWAFQGPTTSLANGKGIGRIQRVVFHPTDSNTFWACSAGGGAWKTTTNGTSWTCMTDQLPVLGVADLAYNPLNTSVIYLATGDRDANDNSSLGLLKSTDGGVTWNQTGFQFQRLDAKRIGTVLVNPLDTASILIATTDGIYNSRNGGATWTLRQAGNFRDLLYRPNDTVVVYATIGTNGNSQIYRSGDGGFSWTKVTSVAGNPSRVSIAVSAASPNMVKAIFANTLYGLEGIYTSTDTGNTFTKTFNPSSCTQNYLANSVNPGSSNCDGQGWYDLALAVSPLDPNKMLIGGVNTWYSTNGGVNWQLANQWTPSSITSVNTVHADKHYIVYQPLRPNVIFECNDGGLYKTLNDPSTLGWMDLTNGLGITQFYRLAVANYATYAIGGAQDNGSKRIQASGAGSSELTGGDGMNCEMDPTSSSTYYTALQYGSIYRNSNYPPISNNIPGRPSGDWITPYKLHPRDGSRIVAGYDLMYLSYDQGDNWTAISPKLSSALIKRVAFAPSNTSAVYAVWGNVVRKTLDNGASWTNMTGAVGGSISDIVIDRFDKQHFWVTFSGYSLNKVAEYDTVNGWRSVSDSLPNVPVNCITQDTSNGTLYIGTDVAVFYRTPTMDHWGLWSTNLPSAEVTDLDINYTTDDIWASTYGRGMWKSQRLTFPQNPSGVSIIPYASDLLRISPNPNNGDFEIRTENPALTGQSVVINILDLNGRTVWSGQNSFSNDGMMHVMASGLARAHYIVDITTLSGLKARTRMIAY